MPLKKLFLKEPTKSCFIFNRYGDKYFLSKVQAEGDLSGFEFRKTAEELEVEARNLRVPTAITASISHR
jgi:hypothetical protein